MFLFQTHYKTECKTHPLSHGPACCVPLPPSGARLLAGVRPTSPPGCHQASAAALSACLSVNVPLKLYKRLFAKDTEWPEDNAGLVLFAARKKNVYKWPASGWVVFQCDPPWQVKRQSLHRLNAQPEHVYEHEGERKRLYRCATRWIQSLYSFIHYVSRSEFSHRLQWRGSADL